MGLIKTDQWLKESIDEPLKICERLLPYFKNQSSKEIYQELVKFGMYRPSLSIKKTYNMMLNQNAWGKFQKVFEYYQEKWSGPNIPIFLFPLERSRGFFTRQNNTKSGVSYPDKMFLFISDLEDPKELEALFVHEYHHVCRLRKLKRNIQEYTLLESLIIEGLAEYAVLKNCGRNYLAEWCKKYSQKEIQLFWHTFLKSNLEVRKSERAHDNLLYGGGRYPQLLGYAVGFAIVENYYNRNIYNTKLSFSLPAENFIGKNEEFSRN